MKVSVLWEDLIIFSIYAPNKRLSNYMRKKKGIEPQGKWDESTIIDFNTPLSITDWSSRQKISKDKVEFNTTINQLDILDIYGILYPK